MNKINLSQYKAIGNDGKPVLKGKPGRKPKVILFFINKQSNLLIICTLQLATSGTPGRPRKAPRIQDLRDQARRVEATKLVVAKRAQKENVRRGEGA